MKSKTLEITNDSATKNPRITRQSGSGPDVNNKTEKNNPRIPTSIIKSETISVFIGRPTFSIDILP